MDMLSLLQWPAMVATLIAGWLVGSTVEARRRWGFRLFVGSNVLWVIWGWQDRAFALIGLQMGLFLLNLRGAHKNSDC